MVISSREIEKSLYFPRTSPDGRWLSVGVHYLGIAGGGEGEILLVDLNRERETGRFEPHKLELSPGYSRAWHSWSSEGRWIVFSCDRETGRFVIKPYLAYVDEEGRAHKAVPLPMEDPSVLGQDPFMHDLPELIDEPVRVSARRFARAIRSMEFQEVDATSCATPPAPVPP